MAWVASDTFAISIVIVLAGVALGELVVLVAGWRLGDRTRRVVAGIGWLALAALGALVLSWYIGAELSSLTEVVGEPRPTTLAVLSLAGTVFVLSFELSDRREQGGLAGRLALALVMLMGAGLPTSALLPIANDNLREAVLILSGAGWMLIVMGAAFSNHRPWTAYGAGLLIVASSAFMAWCLAILHHRTSPVVLGLSAAELVLAVGVPTGVLMTLYGNLRHPGQWLAAGAGVAAVVVGAAIYGTDLITGTGLKGAAVLVFWAGLLTILIAPRLVGWYMRTRQAQ